jgi:hydrogenase nickel incorporation protein HypA/HybF
MHEMSIIEALLEQVRQETRPGTSVRMVRLRVGKLRQCVPEMLTFCYTAAVPDGSQLEIEEVPAEARCRRCSLTFAVEDNWFECPRCRSSEADLLRGNELQLLSLELTKAA